ncbi:MAG: hypothetical protein K2I37_01615, partial [Muribaculaceae bacterium]|nr:hypothetical protein [Muribaculaceae bacterium]
PRTELQFVYNAVEDDFTESIFWNFQWLFALQSLVMYRTDKILAAKSAFLKISGPYYGPEILRNALLWFEKRNQSGAPCAPDCVKC